jgi:hypothetical protein
MQKTNRAHERHMIEQIHTDKISANHVQYALYVFEKMSVV